MSSSCILATIDGCDRSIYIGSHLLTRMIRVDPIQRIIRAAIFSGYLKDEKPLSVIIIGKPESGKTQMLEAFYELHGVKVLTDATAYGIIKATDELKDIENGTVKHLIIPDLTTPMAKRYETTRSFISFMNALIEEGIIDISTYATNIKRSQRKAVRCGFITAVTEDMFSDKRHGWGKIGFLSRTFPVSYDYCSETQHEIFDHITRGRHLHEPLEDISLPLRMVDVTLDERIAKELIPYVQAVVRDAEELYGFRLQRQVQTLLKACALMDGRTEVTTADKHVVIEMMEYANIEHKKEI